MCSCSAPLAELCLPPPEPLRCSTGRGPLLEGTLRRWDPRGAQAAAACQSLGELLQPAGWQSRLTWEVPDSSSSFGTGSPESW